LKSVQFSYDTKFSGDNQFDNDHLQSVFFASNIPPLLSENTFKNAGNFKTVVLNEQIASIYRGYIDKKLNYWGQMNKSNVIS
jgi:hypothetical protein